MYPSGSSLSNTLRENRPTPLFLGRAHDHSTTAQMALASAGTLFGRASKSLDDNLTDNLETIDQFQDELKKTAVAQPAGYDPPGSEGKDQTVSEGTLQSVLQSGPQSALRQASRRNGDTHKQILQDAIKKSANPVFDL